MRKRISESSSESDTREDIGEKYSTRQNTEPKGTSQGVLRRSEKIERRKKDPILENEDRGR